MNKSLQVQLEKRHGIDLRKDDMLFIDLYQKHQLNAKEAYTTLCESVKENLPPLNNYVTRLKGIILDLVEANLVMEAGQAALTLSDLMSADEAVPQANIKLEASKTVLDRVGLGKRETLVVDSGSNAGLFVIPAKKAVVLEEEKVIEGDYEEVS